MGAYSYDVVRFSFFIRLFSLETVIQTSRRMVEDQRTRTTLREYETLIE